MHSLAQMRPTLGIAHAGRAGENTEFCVDAGANASKEGGGEGWRGRGG